MSEYAEKLVDDLFGRLRWWKQPGIIVGLVLALWLTWIGLDDRFLLWLGGVLTGTSGVLGYLIYKLRRMAVAEFRA